MPVNCPHGPFRVIGQQQGLWCQGNETEQLNVSNVLQERTFLSQATSVL